MGLLLCARARGTAIWSPMTIVARPTDTPIATRREAGRGNEGIVLAKMKRHAALYTSAARRRSGGRQAMTAPGLALLAYTRRRRGEPFKAPKNQADLAMRRV